MEVPTIRVERSDALRKIREYKSLNARQRTAEDDRLQALYQMVSKGARVLNVREAFKTTGLSEKGQPRLAIARGDWKTVRFQAHSGHSAWDYVSGGGKFSDADKDERWRPTQDYVLKDGAFDSGKLTGRGLRSPVPHIPPGLRPKYSRLSNFYILFEVQSWEEYPRDPFLLRRIEGDLFVVVAEWELTELEAMLLGSIVQGN
jgi:hypothetical protein